MLPGERTPRSERPKAPQYLFRLISVALTWAFSIAAAGLLIHAIVQTNKHIAAIVKAVPPPTIVTVNYRPLRIAGGLAAAATVLLATLTTMLLITTFSCPTSQRSSFLPCAVGLAAFTLWLLGALIPFTYRYATGAATIAAAVDGIALPVPVVQKVLDTLRITNIYRKIDYLRAAVIVPWFAFLFAALATVAYFIAAHDVMEMEKRFANDSVSNTHPLQSSKPEGLSGTPKSGSGHDPETADAKPKEG